MPDNGKTYYDLLGPFPDGCNGGVAPLLLPKTQLAFALNATVRGGYAQDRPPYQIRGFDFGSSAPLQQAVEGGFFQGCGVYRPDFGTSQIVAQISGRLFTFTDNGVAFTVAEITIPGDPNDATIPQAWMWQSEQWLIISDGSGRLPIFYDGVSCRRSYGPEQLYGTGTAFAPASPPAIGSTVQVTVPGGFTGPMNVPVRFNNAFYQVVAGPAATYSVILTNVSGTPGNPILVGSQIMVQPDRIGFTTTNQTVPVTFGGPNTFHIPMTSVFGVSVGDSVIVPMTYGIVPTVHNVVMTVTVVDTLTNTLTGVTGGFPFIAVALTASSLIVFSSTHGPAVLVGTTQGAGVIPVVGGTVTLAIDVAYTGPDNATVWIGNDEYTIANPPVPPAGVTVYLLNLNDPPKTPAVPYVNPTPIYSISELPACRMGAYVLGQNWVCLVDGEAFIPSDLVGSSSGTQANSYRDAVLKTTDADIMGAFRIPTSGYIINSITGSATLDTSLGQGAVIIGTMANMFTCKAPFTLQDFQSTLVQPMANPILTESLIGFGPLGQNSTVLANSDILFRSIVGLASLKLARRDISDDWGNTPISREMSQIIDPDNNSPLLSYSSAVVHDNRHRMTVSPKIASQGVYHQGEIALNFDLISSLRGKAPPVYDGLWTGLNVLQHTSGLFSNRERSFAMTLNLATNVLELYELLQDSTLHKDNGTTRIKWVFETPAVFNQDVKPLTEVVRLIDGEIYVADLKDTAHVKVQYRPIFYPCWIDWTEFDVCADMTPTNAQPQVRYRLGLGEPSGKDCDVINNQPFREAVAFQLRFEITGHFVFWGVKLAACAVPQAKFAKPACNA